MLLLLYNLKLTLLRNIHYYSRVHFVSLQALQLSSTMLTEEVVRIRQACVGLPTPFSQIMVVKHLYIHFLVVFVFGEFYELFSVKASDNFMLGQRHSDNVVLFEQNSHTSG